MKYSFSRSTKVFKALLLKKSSNARARDEIAPSKIFLVSLLLLFLRYEYQTQRQGTGMYPESIETARYSVF